MKKVWVVILFVAATLLVSVTPALAGRETAGKGRSIRQPFALIGQVTAVNQDEGTITVKVLRGNSTVKRLIGQVLTVHVTDKTIFRRHGDPCEVLEFEDVEVNDYVSIGGVYQPSASTYVALRVIVDVPVLMPIAASMSAK